MFFGILVFEPKPTILQIVVFTVGFFFKGVHFLHLMDKKVSGFHELK